MIQVYCQVRLILFFFLMTQVTARHLDKHLVGYLTWKAGLQSSMNTLLVWDSIRAHITGSIQVIKFLDKIISIISNPLSLTTHSSGSPTHMHYFLMHTNFL